MKKVTKFFMAALLAGMCSFGHAQDDKPDYFSPPKQNEDIIGIVQHSFRDMNSGDATSASSVDWPRSRNSNELYLILLKEARMKYPNYPNLDIRNMDINRNIKIDSHLVEERKRSANVYHYDKIYDYTLTGKVVNWIDPNKTKAQNISKVIDKALRNVREGSRLALDQVSVDSSIDREEFKDQIIDILLDKGYRVVAKEYLEKLYDEIKDQGSGIYNDKTTVKEDNFSAVGYYINVKVTETSLRVLVVNVSTGEYEGNATVNF